MRIIALLKKGLNFLEARRIEAGIIANPNVTFIPVSEPLNELGDGFLHTR